MKKFRILMFSSEPYGGFHHYVAALCNALAKHSDVKAIHYLMPFRHQTLFGVGSEENEILDPAVQICYLAQKGLHSPHRKYWIFLKNLICCLRGIWQGSYDVIHIQTPTDSLIFDLILLVCCKIAGIPIVRTVHEVHPSERVHGISPFWKWWAYLQLRLANTLIVHDRTMKERLGKILRRDSELMTVIPHGNYLGFRKHVPDGYDDLHADREKKIPVVLFFGVKRHKGLEIFLQAWRMVQDDGYPFKALLAGTVFSEDAHLIEIAQQLPGIEVHPRYIPNTQLWEYFCRSSVVAMPYLFGTTSGAVHLAYAFGRPVIASGLDCFKEMVIPGKTGLFVPPGDAFALKNAIIQMCEDPELCRQMGEEGFRLTSSPRFSWCAIADQTVQVYRKASII
jgi:glycosyltransferase involved in cell wall biosynthesis